MNARALVITVALPACLLKPPPPGNGATDGGHSDARGSGSGSGGGSGGSGSGNANFAVRVISNAFYGSNHSDAPGMSSTGFEISTAGVDDGDLLVLIGNVDNGLAAPEVTFPYVFHELFDSDYGSDGQSYFAAWRIADGEPDLYLGTYANTAKSQDSVFTLLAISGADPGSPVNYSAIHIGSSYDGAAVSQTSLPGDTTSADGCIIITAGGADWSSSSGGSNVTVGFTGIPTSANELSYYTDDGSNANTLEKTSQAVGWFQQQGSGEIGTTTITTHNLNPNELGEAWGMVIAVKPAGS